MTLRQGQAKEARLNGARLPSAESLRRELSTLVFTPDRLTVVKGGPAARRAYFDRVIGARLSCARRRTTGLSRRPGETERCTTTGAGAAVRPRRARALDRARRNARRNARRRAPRNTRDACAGVRRPRAASSVCRTRLGYDAGLPRARLSRRVLPQDIERGTTGLGPHLDDVLVASGDRDLRQFGSQGEQRLAVLSLLLAEAELLTASRRSCSSTTSSRSSTWAAGRCLPSGSRVWVRR